MTRVIEHELFQVDGQAVRRIRPVEGGRRYLADLNTGDGLLLDGSAIELFAAAKAEAERKEREDAPLSVGSEQARSARNGR